MSETATSMDVEINEEQVQEMRNRLGDLITGQLLQRPNEALIAELLTPKE